MAFEDKTINCRDCQLPFVFTAAEQEFFAVKQLMNEPKRCPNCRILVRMQKEGKDKAACTELPCAQCGVLARVPFKPTRDKPVYCSYCLHMERRKSETQTDSVEEL